MKNIFFALLVTLLVVNLSCKQFKGLTSVETNRQDSAGLENVLSISPEQQKENERNDRVILDRILTRALDIAKKHVVKAVFEESFVETMSDSLSQVLVDMHCGFYFIAQNPHLIIKRKTQNTIYIDIFSKVNNEYHKELSHEQWLLEYLGDTICDINGDGRKDFVVNCYGVNGCCLKAYSDVYLLRVDTESFSEIFEFLNPSFSPKEHIIRGICYGHPGETEMYKYKWNGEKIDTLEYVFYEKNEKGKKTGAVLISDKEPLDKNCKIIKRYLHVPEEYRQIYGFNWFTGK